MPKIIFIPFYHEASQSDTIAQSLLDETYKTWANDIELLMATKQ